jgi:RHS repeat-associated protein
MPGRTYTTSGNGYRYGFNGKENDNEVKGQANQQDYGMRIYDGRLGKFLSVDPITKKYAGLTPYQFASNTPVAAIDLDGKEAWVVIWASQSKDIDDDGYPQIGHAGIIVANYETIPVYDNETGQVAGVTYKTTKNYTYYDLWPAPPGADMDNPYAQVNPIYQKLEFTVMSSKEVDDCTKSWDMSGSENYFPDGVLKLNISPKLTIDLNDNLRRQAETKAKYNAKDNNCTSNVANALNGIGYKLQKETDCTWLAAIVKGTNPCNSFFTPNKLYNDLLAYKTTTVVKDASGCTKETFEEALVDPSIAREFKGTQTVR